MSGPGQPSLRLLLSFRDQTGQSLEEILDLPPPKQARTYSIEEVQRVLNQTVATARQLPAMQDTMTPIDQMVSQVAPPPRPPTKATKRKQKVPSRKGSAR
jgi:hypothetical protein